MAHSPQPLGTLRSIAIACSPNTSTARRLVELAAAPEIKVTDGDRWTAYASPDLTVALAGPTEMPSGATVSLNVKVRALNTTLAALVEAGATISAEPAEGNHEVRAAVWLSDSVALTLYQPL